MSRGLTLGLLGLAIEQIDAEEDVLAIMAGCCRNPQPVPSTIVYQTRVMSLWNRGSDRLWRQGIDLIGDDGGHDMGERVLLQRLASFADHPRQ